MPGVNALHKEIRHAHEHHAHRHDGLQDRSPARSDSAPNFYADQADRFEVLSSQDGPQPDDAVFGGGTMTWCATVANALLLRAYEQASGFRASLLWDLVAAETVLPAGGYDDSYVVLSSRPWNHWQPTPHRRSWRSSPAARLDPKTIDAERREGFTTTDSRPGGGRYPSTQR